MPEGWNEVPIAQIKSADSSLRHGPQMGNQSAGLECDRQTEVCSAASDDAGIPDARRIETLDCGQSSGLNFNSMRSNHCDQEGDLGSTHEQTTPNGPLEKMHSDSMSPLLNGRRGGMPNGQFEKMHSDSMSPLLDGQKGCMPDGPFEKIIPTN